MQTLKQVLPFYKFSFPNLGASKYKNYKDIIIADIPGIIKNAFSGAGLGLKFCVILKNAPIHYTLLI